MAVGLQSCGGLSTSLAPGYVTDYANALCKVDGGFLFKHTPKHLEEKLQKLLMERDGTCDRFDYQGKVILEGGKLQYGYTLHMKTLDRNWQLFYWGDVMADLG